MSLTQEARSAGGAAEPLGTFRLTTEYLDSAQTHIPAQEEKRNPAAVAAMRRELNLQFLHECAGGIRIHAELVQTFAEIGDTAGVCYALRRLFAHVKAAHHGGAEASLLALYGAHFGGSQP
jgi:hypothetical protein